MKFFFNKLQERKKYFLTIILLLLASICFTLFKLSSIKQSEEIQLNYELLMKKNQLDLWLNEQKRLVKELSYNLEFVPVVNVDYLFLMKNALKSIEANSIFSGFNDGQYFDTQGYWTENFDPRKRPWYQETINTDDVTISGPMDYLDITGRKIIWWAISSSITNAKQHIGVVSAEFLPDMFTFKLSNPLVHNVDLLLVEKSSGFIIASTQKYYENKLFQNYFSKDNFKQLQLTENQSFSTNKKDQSLKLIMKQLEEAPWILCAIQK